MVKSASVDEARACLDVYLQAPDNGPLVILKDGNPVGVLIPLSDDDEVERLVLAYSPRFRRILDQSYENARHGEGLTHTQAWEAINAEARDLDDRT